MRKVWIEVALNGAWSRALQPGIPDTVEAIIAEGVECARAGAVPRALAASAASLVGSVLNGSAGSASK
jgi:hypothetical protein